MFMVQELLRQQELQKHVQRDAHPRREIKGEQRIICDRVGEEDLRDVYVL
jgi:hypothetical protein